MKLTKSDISPAHAAWKQERSDERWERRADMLMFKFSHVTVMLPSQITHIKKKQEASGRVSGSRNELLPGVAEASC